MRGRGIVLALAVTLAAAVPASAHPTALALAQQAAGQYWRLTPCPIGGVTIRYGLPAPALNKDTRLAQLWAWASYLTSRPEEPSWYFDCEVFINPRYFSPRQQAERFPEFCALMVHEYGHFFGHEDAADAPRSSIDYPAISPANMSVSPCVARYGYFQPRLLRVERERRSAHAGKR